jgi:hypothetical protein
MSREKPYILLVDPVKPEARKWLAKNVKSYLYISMENHYSSEDFQDIIEFADEQDRTMFALRWV